MNILNASIKFQAIASLIKLNNPKISQIHCPVLIINIQKRIATAKLNCRIIMKNKLLEKNARNLQILMMYRHK